MKLLCKCLIVFLFFISSTTVQARAYNPTIENWRLIHMGYDKLFDDDLRGAIDDLTESLSRSSELALDDSLNMMLASAFGLCICCDRLNFMDEVYKEIGKKITEFLILDDDNEDFFEQYEQHESNFNLDYEGILSKLDLCKNDLYQLEASCKDARLKKLIKFLSSKLTY